MAMRTKRHREAARRGASVPRHSRTIPNGKEGQTCFPIRNGNQGLTFFPIRSETFGQTFRLIVAWDPTEPVATRPLVLQRQGGWNFFYTHDGNKNVSDIVSFQQARGVPAHYEYAPFGAVTAATTNTAFTAFNVVETNPYRFSSEYSDDTLGLVYYNYRHYEPQMGRWCQRDFIRINEHAYLYVDNRCFVAHDYLGLKFIHEVHMPGDESPKGRYDETWSAQTELTKNPSITTFEHSCGIGRTRYTVKYDDMRVDTYFHVIPSERLRHDEEEHVECYEIYYNEYLHFMNSIANISCTCTEVARKLHSIYYGAIVNAAMECTACNDRLDRKGGPHAH